VARTLMCAIALAALSLASSGELHAQHDPWTISIEAEGGGYFPVRSFGKNTVGEDDPDLVNLQPSAKAEEAFVAGIGIRVQLPDPSMSLRLSAYRTLDQSVKIDTPVCEVLDPRSASSPQSLFNRLRCDSPFFEDLTVNEVIARLQFKTTSPLSRLRPTIDLGLGLRQYDFDGLTCPGTLLEEARFICEQGDDLTADQTQPVVIFGLGLEYSGDRFNPFVRLHAQISPYGGNAIGEEEAQQEVLGSVGLSINVF